LQAQGLLQKKYYLFDFKSKNVIFSIVYGVLMALYI